MKKFIIVALAGMMVMFFGACKDNAKNHSKKETAKEVKKETKAEEVAKVETVYSCPDNTIVATEETIYAIPVVTTPKKTEPKPATPKKETASVKPQEKVSTGELQRNLATVDVKPAKRIDTSFFCFQADELNTVKTVTSYQKKGEEVLQVVSDPMQPDVIDYIVFTDKHGDADVYGVNTGLSGKETRHLRRELKHFIRKGKVFLYTEDSNIMYELDGVTTEGKSVTNNEIDNMHVAAVIWKDKTDKAYTKGRK